MSGAVIWLVLIGLYFVPTIVAANRHARNVGSIVVVNVFLGWTLIGWVIALAMALSSNDENNITINNNVNNNN